MKNDQEMWCRECRKVILCRFQPSPEAGPFWRCSECGEALENMKHIKLHIDANEIKPIIKFKKLHPDAQVPVKAHETDACYDCFAVSMKDHGNGVIEYDMGFAIEMPDGGRVDFRPRSSIYKTGLILCNSIGTVDQGYTNACRAFFYNIIKELPNYKPGDRICQMLFDFREDVEFVEVQEFSNENTARGLGGFGSSGK